MKWRELLWKKEMQKLHRNGLINIATKSNHYTQMHWMTERMKFTQETSIYLFTNPNPHSVHLQKALIIFSRNYSDQDIRKNPVNFTGSFAYYRLFEVLDKKASAWEKLYRKTSRPEDLKAAYETYQSAISLLAYIERSYEMDDAKILLKQK